MCCGCGGGLLAICGVVIDVAPRRALIICADHHFNNPWVGGFDFGFDFWDHVPALCGGRGGGNVYFTSSYLELKRGRK